jgi:hypothetical protein
MIPVCREQNNFKKFFFKRPFQCLVALSAFAAASAYPYPFPFPQGGALAIPRPGPDGSYAKDHYFQVPIRWFSISAEKFSGQFFPTFIDEASSKNYRKKCM